MSLTLRRYGSVTLLTFIFFAYSQVAEYGDEGFKVFSFCPGFTVSNLSSMNTVENGAKPTSEGVAPIVKILGGERDGEHGGFLHSGGQFSW